MSGIFLIVPFVAHLNLDFIRRNIYCTQVITEKYTGNLGDEPRTFSDLTTPPRVFTGFESFLRFITNRSFYIFSQLRRSFLPSDFMFGPEFFLFISFYSFNFISGSYTAVCLVIFFFLLFLYVHSYQDTPFVQTKKKKNK